MHGDDTRLLLKGKSIRLSIARLALVGGTNSENLIRRMLATALTNALACRELGWKERQALQQQEAIQGNGNTRLHVCCCSAVRPQADPQWLQ
ncbi:hypothetical protein KUCAC02_012717 [Chaenocephalus aceratus]|uniref:Uncharacterized protein n=1 Tax=Chaenocephalus aceratus TaxID=36190 RepID=A0ACB9XCS5_CHAAC|nr:hypothetical protein KUCAC02_012717 [Chaenocephalus aceratus]